MHHESPSFGATAWHAACIDKLFRQNAIFHDTDHAVLRILVKLLWNIPDIPSYSNGTKLGTLHFGARHWTPNPSQKPKFHRSALTTLSALIVRLIPLLARPVSDLLDNMRHGSVPHYRSHAGNQRRRRGGILPRR